MARRKDQPQPSAPHRDEAELFEHIREQLSPHAVAAIASWLQPAYTNDPQTNRQIAWFRDGLTELLGADEQNRLCEELGL